MSFNVNSLTLAAESNDFLPTTVELTFQPTTATQPQCADIAIVGDEILEDDEEFSLFLSTGDPDVIIGLASATVTILNDDSKPIHS